jgi:N-acetylmuramoyl-L-alanine amidase
VTGALRVVDHPSPNFGERRGGQRPRLVVLHFTGMASPEAARERLCDPAAEVSAHWLLMPDGTALRMVDEALRAWHAGAGTWGGVGDVNSRSIGIELANSGAEPFAAPQMAALEALLRRIRLRWGIPPQGVIGHADMAPERKADPGPRFDWRRLARAGLAVWPSEGAAPADPSGFPASARAFGYPDAAPERVLAAFRARFRPWAAGPLDATDAGLAADLARRFPVDAGPAAP